MKIQNSVNIVLVDLTIIQGAYLMSSSKNLKAITEVVAEQRVAVDKEKLCSNVSGYKKPRTRSECKNMKRPCLFITCKYHLYLDVNPDTKSIKFNFPDKEIWDLDETCALDIAENGGCTLDEVGLLLNVTRERIRQLQVKALHKLKKTCNCR